MQNLLRVFCIAYWLFLTALLLTSDPMRLVGVRENVPMLLRLLLPAAHFLSFLVLAVLTLMVRWPLPRWGITFLLVLYAGMTEAAQGFTPARTAEWADSLQDLAGIAVGVAFCWIVAMVGGAFVGHKQESERYDLPGTSDEREAARIVMPPRAVTRSQSWWG